MTTTINDISDLARILDEHPEWVDTLRSLLLTRETLDLPAALDRLTELVNDSIREQRETNQRADQRLARLDELAVNSQERLDQLTELVNDFIREQRETNQRADERMAELAASSNERLARLDEIAASSNERLARLDELAANSQERLDQLTELVNDFIREQRETNQRNDERLANQEGRVANLDEVRVSTDRRLTSLETITRRMQGQIGLLIGEAAERRIQGHLDVVLSQRLNLRRVTILKSVNLGIDRSLADQLEAAQDNQIITPGQHLQVRLLDVILSATDRETAAPLYIAAEISLTLNRHDIARAAERAAILEQATGIAAQAAVIGGRIPPLQETQAAAGVHIILMEDLDLDSDDAGE